MERDQHLWGIVLAAGSGERLHPFLRRGGHRHPIKQFCAVTDRRTMLQHTWDRIEMLGPRERVVTVTDAAHADMCREQLGDRYSPCARRKPQGRRDCRIQEE